MEEETRRREHGFPHTLEVSALPDRPGASGFTAEGTVLHDGSPRVIQIDGIALEAQLDGTILYLRNHDEPGVIGHVGTTLGKHGVNIATFALGRREATRGAEAVSLVRLDGQVTEAVLGIHSRVQVLHEPKLHKSREFIGVKELSMSWASIRHSFIAGLLFFRWFLAVRSLSRNPVLPRSAALCSTSRAQPSSEQKYCCRANRKGCIARRLRVARARMSLRRLPLVLIR